MMPLAVSPRTMEYLGQVEGETTDEKVLRLLETYLSSQFMACEREIAEYEVKYRSTFAEFAGAWADGAVAARRSHAVERDYMEWEGLEAEKRRWLEMLKQLPGNRRPR